MAKEGKPVFEKAYGMANYEWGVPNALKLEEMGKLKVADKACDYLPSCPETWKPITIHQLLTHTSGIPNFTSVADYAKVKPLPSRYDEQVKLVLDMKMDFDPGTKFQYSNTGYVILGKIIEKAGDRPWEDFLHQELFLPAGMNDIMGDRNAELIMKRASGYRSNGGSPVPQALSSLQSGTSTSGIALWQRAKC